MLAQEAIDKHVSVAVSAIKALRDKKELVAEEVQAMMQNPFYYSNLLLKAEEVKEKKK